jgi:hypothetical protein
MSELLLHTIIDKLNMESQVVETIRERLETLPDNTESLNELNTQLNSIEKTIQKISFPEKEVNQLSFDLNRATSIFQQPLKNEVLHHHHVPKLLWITAGLFLIICLVCSGWYTTHNKLENYIAGDTKYRYLKLDSNKNLQKLLLFTDSLYFFNPQMREDVILIEEENKERSELQEQADEKQKEVDALRLKAKKQKR